jgi:hypothetical protein
MRAQAGRALGPRLAFGAIMRIAQCWWVSVGVGVVIAACGGDVVGTGGEGSQTGAPASSSNPGSTSTSSGNPGSTPPSSGPGSTSASSRVSESASTSSSSVSASGSSASIAYGPDSGVYPTAVSGCYEIDTLPSDSACTEDDDCTTQLEEAVVCDMGSTCDWGPVGPMNTAAAARIASELFSVGGCSSSSPGPQRVFCVSGACSEASPPDGGA